MLKYSSLFVSIYLYSCASLSKGVIYKTDDEAVEDSTYIYGYAMVGIQSQFIMTFENESTHEKKTYAKLWSSGVIYKDHLFAFSFPDGAWRLSEIETRGGSHGGHWFHLNKKMEIKKGVGNFIGKLDVQKYPMDENQFEIVQVLREKGKTDLLMKQKYSGFDVDRTAPIESK